MKLLSALLAIALAAPPCFAGSADVCPALPGDSGLIWIHQEGPDFDLCYAATGEGESPIFGMYLGAFPSFEPDDATAIGEGKVAGLSVVWYLQDEDDDPSPLSRQTLLVPDPKRVYLAHLWITATTEEELASRLSILERITFQP